MDHFSLANLIFIGFIIYVFYRLLTGGGKKDSNSRSSGNRDAIQKDHDLRSFRSAPDEMKREPATFPGVVSSDGNHSEEMEQLYHQRRKNIEPVYHEQPAEPEPIIRGINIRTTKDSSPRSVKPNKRDPLGFHPATEVLMPPGESGKAQYHHNKLIDSLTNVQSLQHAVLLREVLDPPVSKRKHHLNRL